MLKKSLDALVNLDLDLAFKVVCRWMMRWIKLKMRPTTRSSKP